MDVVPLKKASSSGTVVVTSTGGSELAGGCADGPESSLPTAQPGGQSASLLAEAGDDELVIALYYDELADLEMIEQLELLEALAAIEELEEAEQG